MIAAERLRNGTDPISAIARSVGYYDPRYFATRFRHHFHSTPLEWRNSGQALPDLVN